MKNKPLILERSIREKNLPWEIRDETDRWIDYLDSHAKSIKKEESGEEKMDHNIITIKNYEINGYLVDLTFTEKIFDSRNRLEREMIESELIIYPKTTKPEESEEMQLILDKISGEIY